jgi:hypothetical protein
LFVNFAASPSRAKPISLPTNLRPLRRVLRTAALAITAFALSTASAEAQSLTLGTVTGRITTVVGVPIAQALVTLHTIGDGVVQQATTTSSGAFTISLVQPGSYELRVEALGYRPLIARTLTLGGGEERHVDLSLTPEPPPVTAVDTVALGGGASSRFRAGALQLGEAEASGLPNRFSDLGYVAARSTTFDGSFGGRGLPGDQSLLVVDGVPFYRAAHPTARSEFLPGALIPSPAVSGVALVSEASDIEWHGAAGSYVSVATRSSVAGSPVEFGVSGSPMWSSSRLDVTAPTLTSFRGSAATSVPLASENASLVVTGEAVRQQSPLAVRASEGLASSLAGLDADLLSALSEPGVETFERYGGLARLDIQQGRDGRFFLRGSAAWVERSFDGIGPVATAGAIAPAEESLEFSAAGGWIRRSSDRLTFELRGGFSGSMRDFGASGVDPRPAMLVSAGIPMGDVATVDTESSRTDLVVLPGLRYQMGSATLKFGAFLRATNHSMTLPSDPAGYRFYAGPAALLSGTGFALTGSSPQADFSTQEYGAYAQYDAALAPGVRISFAGRYDLERIAGDEVSLNEEWFDVSGLANAAHPRSFHQFGGRGAFEWDPSGNGDTRVSVVTSIHEGDIDPRAIARLHAQAADATASRFAGSGLSWPGGDLPAAATDLPTVTLLGPDTRAPRSMDLGVGVVQRLTAGVTAYLSGSSRRTDFLLRQRNLNLPVTGLATDPDGRPMYGELWKDGSLVATVDAAARRFPDFAEVWALDPDGWSEYLGVTAGLEYSSAAVDLFAAYTFSETRDNWVGAAAGAVHAELSPLLSEPEGTTAWAEGVSDYDVPHRASAIATLHLGPADLSAVYRFRSGLPFTPGYRAGVDINGDGSGLNDVAFVPTEDRLGGLADAWPCLADQAGGFAVRNSCRAPDRHTVDVRLRWSLGSILGQSASMTLDAFNLVESDEGLRDAALLLVDAGSAIQTSPDGSTVTVPTIVNPGFGSLPLSGSRGRVLQIGVRVGG